MNKQQIIERVCYKGETIKMSANDLARAVTPMTKLSDATAPLVVSFLNRNEIDCKPNIFVCIHTPQTSVTLTAKNINSSRRLYLKQLHIEKYKLFHDFTIDFAQTNISIFIGENGNGKSTLIEYLTKVFAYLFVKAEGRNLLDGIYTLGSFVLEYSLVNENSTINIKIENESSVFAPIMSIGGNELKKINKTYLPKNIIISYSGITRELQNVVENYFEMPFVKRIIQDGDKYTLMPSCNLPNNDFYFSRREYLSALFISLMFSNSEESKELIAKTEFDNFNCQIQFVTLTPEYIKSETKNNFAYEDIQIGDNVVTRFRGRVAPQFMDILAQRGTEDLTIDTKTYAFDGFSNVESMFKLFKEDITSKQVFDILYYLIHNQLLGKINIVWGENLEFSLDTISEGQKQEIMTLGLSLIFDTPSTLFLLDEPDTYLHPKWQREFISSLTKATANGGYAIVSSHSPSIVSDVKKEQLFILNKGRLVETSFNNYGKEVNEILIDYFGLDSTRSKFVQEKIDELRDMIAQDEYETESFKQKFDDLSNLVGADDEELTLIKIDIKRRKYAKNK